MSLYVNRIVETELDDLFGGLAALSIEGAKGVGKTATATRRAEAVLALDDPEQRTLLEADHALLARLAQPVVVDEWQRHPAVWDLVRRAVDRDGSPGQFLLTGSAAPTSAPTHSGAGRIVSVRMRPLSLAERGLCHTTVSLAALLHGNHGAVGGESGVDLVGYTDEILASGFPGIRPLRGRARAAQLDGYLDRVVEHDFAEQGLAVRRPATLRSWLAAYAGATSSSASYNSILDAATGGEDIKPAKTTTIAYRDILEQLWLIDPVPGWIPSLSPLRRLAQAPKHHLVDPALAARLVGATRDALLTGSEGINARVRDGPLLGAFFESLVTQSVRVYAQAALATVHHLRTRGGEREVDLVVEGEDRRVLALEVKLTATPSDADVRHLLWLREQLGDRAVDAAVITTGRYAYRRADGIGVIPAALLGP